MATSASKSPDLNSPNAPLTEKSVAAAHQAIDNLSSRLSKTETSVRDIINDSSHNLSEKQEEIRSRVESSVGDAKTFVNQNPLMAAGIAFAAGVVVASLLRR